jgi:hypothetical protein
MRRWFYIAAFSVVLLSLPAWAQRRGGGAAHSSSSGGGFAAHPSGPSYGGNVGHSSSTHFGTGNSYTYRYHYPGNSYGRRYYYRYGSYYPYAAYYPYGGYYGWYPDSGNYQDGGYQDGNQGADSYADSNYPGPYRSDNESGLQRDVQALSSKIDRLQADVEARNRPKEMEPATALVFRDQHVEEVRNYAISGGTLWVLSDKAAKKIPLAQLDLDATVKMNDDRGVDFQVPR